jgi:threonine dehydratase
VIPREWFEEADERIRGHALRTPLTYDAHRGLYLKWENRQVTGSFKARGALNKILALEDWERQAGLVAASAGNHGQGVAMAAQLTGCDVEVFVPAHAVANKVESMRRLGALIRFVDGGYGEAETAAKAYAHENGKTYVSPYNDGQVIAGQGTMAVEIIQQLNQEFHVAPTDLGAWIFPVGGGGLICGCGEALAARGITPTMIGVQPEASAFTHSLFHRQTQEGVRDDPTLADGLSGAIDPESITIPMMRRLVKDIVTVSEVAIERAIAHAWNAYSEKIEGSAGAALAAVLEEAITTRPCVVVLTGGNIETDVFDAIVKRHPMQAVR